MTKIKNSQINTPHDKLFRKSMQTPAVAKDFLMLHLPEKVKNEIDYQTLEILPDTFIDETLKRSQVDALFKVKKDNDDLLIYILIEQQSKPDLTMPTRRLSYKSDIWAAYLSTEKNNDPIKLPPIIDLHFYTGPKPYDGPLSLGELAGDNAHLIHESLTEPMINIWAGHITDEELKTHPWAATLEYIFANRRTQNIQRVLNKISGNIELFYMAGEVQFVLSLFTYIENVYTHEISIEELARIAAEEISPRAGDDIMTIAEKLLEEGELKGKLEVARRMLDAGSDPLFVVKVTGLSMEKIKLLQKSDK